MLISLMKKRYDKLNEYYCIRIKITVVYSICVLLHLDEKPFKKEKLFFFLLSCFQTVCVVVLVSRYS